MDKGSKAKVTMAPGSLEHRKRKEIVLTREEAVKKKLPKGYALEPVLPPVPAQPVETVEERESRRRRLDGGKRIMEPLSLNPSEGLRASEGKAGSAGERLHGINGTREGHHDELPGLPMEVLRGSDGIRQSNGGHLSTAERATFQKQFSSELGFLHKISQEIQAREDHLGDHPLSGGSESAGDSRKRIRRTDVSGGVLDMSPPAVQLPDGGVGETSQSGTPLPRLKHSHSMQMSTGDSVGGLTPKRTPKANTAYINQDFISGQDKIPPQEKAKPKTGALKKSGSSTGMNGGRVLDLNDPKRQRIESARSRRMADVLRQCHTVLKRAMTHKYSWVFNTPVDVEALGLHDYLTIIKKPMDLGTVKQRLHASLYQHPDEFYTDVSLVWSNAMTYNPPNSDVHVMAAELKKMFEDSYKKISSKLQEDALKREQEEKELREWTPVREKNEVMELQRRLQALENHVVAQAAAQKPKARSVAGPPKPKPGDKNKREMTYAEKQKLSVNLGKLPSERLDRVLQIITLHNPNFGSQTGEEIELDIDSLDTETLWELDRYVVNCMKSKSKLKKQAVRPAATVQPVVPQASVPEAESFRGRTGGAEGEDSVDIENGGPQGPSASLTAAHKDAHSAKSEDSSSTSGSSDSSSSSDSGSESGSDSDGDEAHSRDVAAKGPVEKGVPGSSPLGAAAADRAPSAGTGAAAQEQGSAPASPSQGIGAGVIGGAAQPTQSEQGESRDALSPGAPQEKGAQEEAPGTIPGGADEGSGQEVAEGTEEVAAKTSSAFKPPAGNDQGSAPADPATVEPIVDDEAALRAALTRQKYANLILKSKHKTAQGAVIDPKKREEMERKQREERAKIEAAAKAAQEASKRKAEQAAAAARKKREEEREAERRRLKEMEHTVEIDENQRVLKELHIFGAEPARTPQRVGEDRGAPGEGGSLTGFPGLGGSGGGGNALGSLGFELADSDEEEENEEPQQPEEVEEGEI